MDSEGELRERWAGLVARMCSSPDADRAFAVIRALHAFPARAYHSLDHVADCLRVLDRFGELAVDLDAVEFAIWTHDCVYIPTQTENERRSADLAEMIADGLAIERQQQIRIRELILATCHVEERLVDDEALIADVDMSILASEAETYANYARSIRDEFRHVGDERFRAGRRAFLDSLLGRSQIFHVDRIRRELEERARRNIAKERRGLA